MSIFKKTRISRLFFDEAGNPHNWKVFIGIGGLLTGFLAFMTLAVLLFAGSSIPEEKQKNNQQIRKVGEKPIKKNYSRMTIACWLRHYMPRAHGWQKFWEAIDRLASWRNLILGSVGILSLVVNARFWLG